MAGAHAHSRAHPPAGTRSRRRSGRHALSGPEALIRLLTRNAAGRRAADGPRHGAAAELLPRPWTTRRAVGAGLAGFVGILALLGLAGVAVAAFSASTASGSTLALASLDSWLPSGVSTSRVTASTCQVSWTPHASAPVGATYDVTDGSSTLVSDVAGTTTVVTVGAGSVTPVVKLRVGSWVSSSGTAAGSACLGWPDAPVVSLTPSESQVAATWTAPAGNGSAVTSYDASISPAGTGTSSCANVPAAASRSCMFTGLVNGVTYTVSVTATNGVGTGPTGTATAIPYPSGVMTSSAIKLWLDGADPTTLFASSSCSGAAASSTVGCWTDKSGQADNATQSTAGSRPALSSLNGHPAAAFDGNSSVMALDVTKLPTGSADSTIWLVATMEDPSPLTTSHRAAIGWGDNGTGTTRAVTKPWHSTLAYQDTFGYPFPSGGSWSAAGTVFSGRLSGGTTSTVDVDGARSYTETISLNTGTAAGAWLGNHIWGNWAYWQGRIAEVVVVNQAATDADNRAVQEYLARKWGLTITPRAPSAVTVSPTAAGTSADVAWSAPSWNGGSVVTGYTVSAVPVAGGSTTTCTAVHPATSCTLSGLAGGGAQYAVTVTAANTVGSGPASTSTTLFAGLPVTANLKLWLDGADPTSMYASSSCSGSAATSAVGCWTDKSGTGNHATQSTGADQPSLATVSGWSVPSFDGSSGSLDLTPGLLPNGTAPSTTFVVGRLTDPAPAASGWRAALSWGTTSPGATRTYEKNDLSAGAVVAAYQQVASSGGTWGAGPGILADAWSSTSYTGYFNTVPGTPSTGSFSTGTTTARVGSNIGAFEFWQGQVPEVLVFGSTLSSTERRAVDEYLATKWGVAITPSAPQAASAVAGNATATVSWTAPSWNGGSAITSYTVTPVGGPGSCTWSAGTSASCTGLSNGTSYTFTVAAVNGVGTGPTATTAAATPTGPPGAPTAVSATAGDTTGSVSWNPPLSGAGITSYTATAVPSDGTLATRTCTSASSPCSLSGLTNGATYTVTVTATSAGGTGSASGGVTLIPFPALLQTANAQLWLDGKDVDGDGVVEGSGENCDTGNACVATANVLTRWEDRSGRNHDGVQATAAMAGTLNPSTGLVTFTANGYYQAASIATGPDATAFAVASSATATWNTFGWLMGGRAANGWILHPNNGSTNTHFMGITSTGYNAQTTVTGDLSPVTAITNPHIWDGWITGSGSQTLNHGVDGSIGSTVASATTRAAAAVTVTIGADDFDLAARRGNGSYRELVAFDRALTAGERREVTEYLARKWSVTVTPSAPQSASATVGSTTATVSWSAPAWNGGAGVSSYTVTPVGGPGSCTWSSGTTASCTGLTNGTSYTFTVAAVNGAGTGPTATTAAVTPYTVPGAPTGMAATADDTVSSVSWSAPASNGGSAITSYTATAVPSDGTLPTRTCSSASSPCSLSGLTNGITYTVSVTATNAAGAGSASSSTTVIPYPKAVMSGAGFKLWLDGADASTLYASNTCSGAAASTTVGCWKDKSGTANNATQGTVANQPTLTTVAGRSVPGYDGSNDRFALTPSLLPTGSTSGTEFAAAGTTEATPASSDYRAILGYGTGAAAQARLLGKYTFSTSAYADTWSSGVVTGGTWVNGVTSVLGSEYASAAVRLTWAGAPFGTATSSSFNTGTTGASVGSNLDSTNYWKGPISEVLVFSTTLSTDDQRSVAEYLARKWGSTITPGAPVSPSASASGTTATVSWSAPTWNGGASISTYTVSTTGGKSCTTSGTSCQITGLVADAAYTFTVTATNSVGTGPGSTTSVTMPSPAQPIDTFELSVWGYGASGRTGVLMQTSTTSTAVRMPGPETWASVSAGTDHTCGLTTGGALYCWGNNANGELGVGDTTMRWEPAAVSAGTTWSSVTAGQDNTCAIKASDSSLWCWGYYGASNLTTPTAITTTGVTTWSSFSVGIQFGCGLKTDGTLWCFGNGSNGRLGNGSASSQTSPVQVSVGTTFSKVTTGEQHACAIRSSDSVLRCWGYNASGRLGDGTTTQASSPVTVSGGLTWSDVSAGSTSTCGITTGGALYCWGSGGLGQLGNGSTSSSSVPVRESTAGTTWVSVTTSFGDTNCGLKVGGAASCWGYNVDGQIGDGSTTDRSSPTASGSISDWTMLSGGNLNVCGVRSDHAIWCQGYDGAGELGQWYLNGVGSPTPVVPFAGPWISGSTGYEGGCGVQNAGTLWCWGLNSTGWNGTGDTTQHNAPAQAGASTAWRSVSVGYTSACSIRSDGTLWCWGYATNGKTGVSGATGNITTPTAGPSDLWSDVSVGETHTCGVTTVGALYCWGDNTYGQLGQGDTTARTTPIGVTATGVTTWRDVTAGYYSTCAIAATGANAGALYCWGMNTSGQAGVGNTSVQYSPARVGASTWSAVAAGFQHACGVRADGTLWCWGVNNQGQLGGGGSAGTPATATSPQQVGAGATWSTVGAGYEFSCATKNDSTLWCWGRNDFRQVGDRSTTTRTSPVQVPGFTGTLQELHGSAMGTLAGS